MPRRTRKDSTLPLFPEEPAGAPVSDSPWLARNRARITAAGSAGIFFGTSSWKYEGWRHQVYLRPYTSRKAFEQECLAEYAGVFPTVCADFALYDFPRPASILRMDEQTPAGFTISFKVTDRITVRRYPNLPRFGVMAGKENPDFLNRALFEDAFLQPVRHLGPKLGAIIFEFSTFHPSSGVTAGKFLEMMDAFLASLPTGYRYAVEVRNDTFLTAEYCALLRRHGVAHVLNNWTKMPPILEQIGREDVLTAPFSVVRCLLRPGRTYQEAVEMFQPYAEVREENPEARLGVAATAERCRTEGRTLFAYINNRAEGNAPKTIEGILDMLEGRRRTETV
jgi:uncharacterized protein YecE (DUF72 family)